MPPDVRFKGQNAPNSHSTGAPPQNPLEAYRTQLYLRSLVLLKGERRRGGEGVEEGKVRGGGGGRALAHPKILAWGPLLALGLG